MIRSTLSTKYGDMCKVRKSIGEAVMSLDGLEKKPSDSTDEN